jgi:protein gp37
MALVESALMLPLRWKKPRRIFVNSMSDLFHENLPDEAIDKVFAVMALCPQHTFQVLTKRPERMRKYMLPTTDIPIMGRLPLERVHLAAAGDIDGKEWGEIARLAKDDNLYSLYLYKAWPLPNVWLGVSVEDQTRADERIPLLLDTPAAKRFLSCEPLLGPVDLSRVRERIAAESHVTFDALSHPDTLNRGTCRQGVDWVIVGGESGPGSRPFNVSWARAIVDQCRDAGVACFVKQLGRRPYWDLLNGCGKWQELTRIDLDGKQVDAITLKDKKGGDMAEWAEDLRVREMPEQ